MRMVRPLSAAIVFAATLSAQSTVKAPTTLKATAASRSAVSLSWTAGDPAVTRYAVERKPLGASWTPPAPPAKSRIVTTMVDAATADDKSIDAFATYVYRVRAAGANNTFSAPSNEITVGPPPVGYSQILTEPSGPGDPSQFARVVTMTL